MSTTSYPTVQRRSMPTPSGSTTAIAEDEWLDDEDEELSLEERTMAAAAEDIENKPEVKLRKAAEKLYEFIEEEGDITHLLDESEIAEIGQKAIDEWENDKGSISNWRDQAERGIAAADQNYDQGDEAQSNFPWEGSSDSHIPLLTQASQQFVARAYPELVKGDKAVSVKTFEPPVKKPSGSERFNIIAKKMTLDLESQPQPTTPQEAQMRQQQGEMLQKRLGELQNEFMQEEIEKHLKTQEQEARASRVEAYLNWLMFYSTSMGNWSADMDQLLTQLSVTGCGFKKIYMAADGLRSEFISPLNLTVHNNTKNMEECPRITHDYTLYPYEIESAFRDGRFRQIEIVEDADEDEQAPIEIIEQYRMEDLDGDGFPEPYIVTVHVESCQVLRIEPAFGHDDIVINEKQMRITRIDRWNPFPAFKFLLSADGSFYGSGFAKLLEALMATVDTALNQTIDAGTAEVAGGGLIGSNVRLPGSGQSGSIYKQPGEYQVVNTTGAALKDSLVDFTLPKPSQVTMETMQLLLGQAKDICSVKDIVTGDSNVMAPVGTTLAVQNQALQVFSSIFKRVYRGLDQEFKRMYDCLKKFGTDRERKQYEVITGGNFDEDFAHDNTDISPVADPTVVTQMQKMARNQALMQLAESGPGQAAGMLQPSAAKAIIAEMLDTMGIDRPERFMADPPAPPPEVIQGQAAMAQAELADKQNAAKLKEAQAMKTAADIQVDQAKVGIDQAKTMADIEIGQSESELNKAKTLHEAEMAQLDHSREDVRLDHELNMAAAEGVNATEKNKRDPE